jgi:DNA modification methylase
MNSKINTKVKLREKPNDIFYTPIKLVEKHLDIIKLYVKPKDKILDPFFGSGRYYNLFNEYFKDNTFDFTEIELKKDFFDYKKEVDV